ncbi:hypothetical protein GCM10009548_59200 [Streptomyces malaysiensis subsp. malaysiensis]
MVSGLPSSRLTATSAVDVDVDVDANKKSVIVVPGAAGSLSLDPGVAGGIGWIPGQAGSTDLPGLLREALARPEMTVATVCGGFHPPRPRRPGGRPTAGHPRAGPGPRRNEGGTAGQLVPRGGTARSVR